MDRVIKIRYELQDAVTAQTQNVVNGLRNVNKEIKRNSDSTKKSVKSSDSALTELGKKFLTMAIAVKAAKTAFGVMIDSLKEFDRVSKGSAVKDFQNAMGQLQVEIGSVLYPDLIKFNKWFEENKTTITLWVTGVASIIASLVKITVVSLDLFKNSFKELVYAPFALVTHLLRDLLKQMYEVASKWPIGDKIKEGLKDAYEYMAIVGENFQEDMNKTAIDIANNYKILGDEIVNIGKQIAGLSTGESPNAPSGVVFMTEEQLNKNKKILEEAFAAKKKMADMDIKLNNLLTSSKLEGYEKEKYETELKYRELLDELDSYYNKLLEKDKEGLKGRYDLLKSWITEMFNTEDKNLRMAYLRDKNKILIDDLNYEYSLKSEYNNLSLTDLENYYDSVISITESTGDEINSIIREKNSARNALLKNLESEFQAGTAATGSSPEAARSNAIKAMETEAERRKQILIDLTESQMYTEKELSDYLISMDQYTANERLRIEQEYTDAKMQNIQSQFQAYADIANKIIEVGQNVTQMQLNNLDRETEAKNKQLDDAYNMDTKYVKNASKLDKQYKDAKDKLAEEQAQKQRELYKKQKGWSIANALIAGAEASMNSWVQAMKLGYPASVIVGGIMQGVIAALTASQVALIGSQKFATGGIIKGPAAGDKVTVQANGGEMMLTMGQQARLYQALNGQGTMGQQVTIAGDTYIVHGNLDKNAADQIIRQKEQRISTLKQDLRELNYRGQLSFAA